MAKLAAVGLVAFSAAATCSLAQDVTPGEQPPSPSLRAPFDASSPLPNGLTQAPQPFEPAGDGKRTFGALPKNVMRGIVGVFSEDNLKPFLIGAGASLASSGLDRGTARLIRNDCRACGKTGSAAGGAAVVPAIGALFLVGRLAPAGRFRAFSYDMAEAAIVNCAWTGALKYSLQRRRPDRGDRLSLPSGHTSTAFSLATVAEKHYGWKVGLPAYAAAVFIGYSRIERNRHNLSDVLAGATLGVIVGRTVTRLNGGAVTRRTMSVGPSTDANGGGVGIGVSATW